METNREWRNFVVPYESFMRVTKGGAMVFEIQDGDLKGYQFLRPAKLVRKSFEKGKRGFSVGYTVEQILDDSGDIVEENPEEITLTLTKKTDDGDYEKQDEMDIEADALEEML